MDTTKEQWEFLDELIDNRLVYCVKSTIQFWDQLSPRGKEIMFRGCKESVKILTSLFEEEATKVED